VRKAQSEQELTMRATTSWLIVLLLAGSFAALAQTAGSGNVAIAVAVLSFVFVFGLWFMYRDFSMHGTLSRAIAVGEPNEVFALLGTTPPRRIGMRGAMPLVLYQVMALDQQGKFADALALLQAHPLLPSAQRWQRLASFVSAGIMAHTDAAAGRALWQRTNASGPMLPRSAEQIMATMADGRLRLAQDDGAGAIDVLLPLTRNVLLGPAPRGMAHHLLAEAYAAANDTTNVELHRTQAQKLGGKLWFTTTAG
jgi:hypothetical protein